MEKITTINGSEVDVEQRPAITRNDLQQHIALFQRDVEGLLRRDENRLREICVTVGIVGNTTESLKDGLIALFASETHYKKRNKLRAQVIKKL